MNTNYYLGLDLGGSNMKVCLFEEAQLLQHEEVVFPHLSTAMEEINFCFQQIDLFIKECSIQRKKLWGIGISCGASIDLYTHKINSWPNRPHWKHIALAKVFAEYYDLEILIEDDTNAAAFAVFKKRFAHTSVENMIYVNIGTGIGAGMILNRRLFRGSYRLAGELGHINIIPEGRLCNCGKRGCLQAYVSGKVLHHSTSDLLNQCAATLGNAIANLVMLLDVKYIVIGGGVLSYQPTLFPQVRQYTLLGLNNRPKPLVKIEPCPLGNKAGAIGLCLLAQAQHALSLSKNSTLCSSEK